MQTRQVMHQPRIRDPTVQAGVRLTAITLHYIISDGHYRVDK